MKDSSNSLYDCVGTLVQMQIDDGTPAAAATVGDGLLVIVCDCSLLIVLVVVNVWKGCFPRLACIQLLAGCLFVFVNYSTDTTTVLLIISELKLTNS